MQSNWALSHLNKYLFKYKGPLLIGTLFVFLNNLFATWQGPIIRNTFNSIESILTQMNQSSTTNNQLIQQITINGLIILGLTIVSGVFLYFQRKILIGTSRKIEYDLKNEIFEQYQNLPLSFYKKNNTGDLMNRISEDVNQVRNYLGPALMYGINLIALFSITVPIMISVNAELAWYTLIPLPFLVIGIYSIQSIITKHSEAIQEQLSALSTHVQETFSGIRIIKAFSMEDARDKQYHLHTEQYRKKSIHLAKISAFFYPLMIGLIGSSTIIILWVGGQKVIANEGVTNGNIAEFIFYLNKLTWPVTSLGWITVLVKRAEVSQKRINDFLRAPKIESNPLSKEILFNGKIEFKDVNFTYPETQIHALKSISFTIDAGKTLAIIGNTGSGKSTISQLIARLYEPTNGQVLIDDREYSSYELHHYRSQLGIVPQEVFLFSDTIRNNIAFGNNNVSEEDIIDAAKFADLYSSIQSFPNGLDTLLGERGISLSGGQKQRLTIARAIIRKPTILVLDDSLSAVDTNTEDQILKNIEHIKSNQTTIIISHRISSVKLADKIIVLDNGQIKEEGTHDELLTKKGVYFETYQQQLKASGK
jgi:ATP-binding cassette subfamily B protein